MVTILADENNSGIGRMLHEGFGSRNIESNYISLEDIEIKPCYSCEGCTYKTYGKCVVRDDGDWIYPKIIKSDTLVFVTPIVFGGYSFKAKRALDKCAVIGDRHYQVVKNQLVKGGMQGKLSNIFVVGMKDNCSALEEATFKALVQENLIITTANGRPYVVKTQISSETIEKMVGDMSL